MGIVINAVARFRKVGAIPLKEESVLFDPIAFYRKCQARHSYEIAVAEARRLKADRQKRFPPVESDYGRLKD